MKERKRKITVITIIGIMLILAITTFTYAIWSRTHTQTGINKNTYACFDISYEETNGTGITMDNGFPQTDEQGMQNDAYEVQITNTCDTVSTYNVILNKEQGSTLKDEHLKVAVDNDYKLLSDATKTDKRTIDNFNNEASYIIGTGVIGPKQTKTIQIRSWMDKDTSEEDGENKNFTFKITIENVVGDSNLLAGKILTSNKLRTEEPDFSKGYPNSADTSLSGLYKTQDDDGDTYYFRGNVENNYVQLGTYKKTVSGYHIGYYNENSSYAVNDYEEALQTCKSDYNIYGYSTEQECIEDIQTEQMQVLDNPIIWRIVRINGDGSIRLIANSAIDISMFHVDSNENEYVGYTYNNMKPCTKSDRCVINYSDEHFTNTHGGSNSTIKEELEKWYKTTLNEVDSKIALTSFCNDTSYGSEDGSNGFFYKSYERINSGNPSLKCPDPIDQNGNSKTYGGIYELKIGLLNIDEAMYGGLEIGNYLQTNNYLNHKYNWWSLSPYKIVGNTDYNRSIVFYFNYVSNISKSTQDFLDMVPVINLKSDVTVTGSGTADDPYVVE